MELYPTSLSLYQCSNVVQRCMLDKSIPNVVRMCFNLRCKMYITCEESKIHSLEKLMIQIEIEWKHAAPVVIET